jgi:Spy/CpxP family protein refolding chaperone
MTLDLDSRDRSRFLAIAVLLAVLAAGLFAGAALTLVFGSRGSHVQHERRLVRGPGGPPMPGDHEGVVFMRRPFGEELDLEPEQRERVERLMEEQRRKAEQLMADMEPRMKALMDSTNAAIEEVLTPEQRERFREMQAERRDMIVRRFEMKIPEPPEPRPEPVEPPPPPGE